MDVADATAVEKQRNRRQRLLGAGISTRRGQWDQRAVVQLAVRHPQIGAPFSAWLREYVESLD